MPRSYAYISIGGPPLAPAMKVIVHSGSEREEEIALLDSGANATAINPWLVSRLGLKPVGEHRVSSPIGTESLRPFFIIDLDFLGWRHRNHPAFLSERTYVIIGRDILNQYRVTLDGPKLRFSIK